VIWHEWPVTLNRKEFADFVCFHDDQTVAHPSDPFAVGNPDRHFELMLCTTGTALRIRICGRREDTQVPIARAGPLE